MNMVDPWRYACPEGHRTVSKRGTSNFTKNDGYVRWYCDTCRETVKFVTDLKTGEELTL